jgi:hypothetical protein
MTWPRLAGLFLFLRLGIPVVVQQAFSYGDRDGIGAVGGAEMGLDALDVIEDRWSWTRRARERWPWPFYRPR